LKGHPELARFLRRRICFCFQGFRNVLLLRALGKNSKCFAALSMTPNAQASRKFFSNLLDAILM